MRRCYLAGLFSPVPQRGHGKFGSESRTAKLPHDHDAMPRQPHETSGTRALRRTARVLWRRGRMGELEISPCFGVFCNRLLKSQGRESLAFSPCHSIKSSAHARFLLLSRRGAPSISILSGFHHPCFPRCASPPAGARRRYHFRRGDDATAVSKFFISRLLELHPPSLALCRRRSSSLRALIRPSSLRSRSRSRLAAAGAPWAVCQDGQVRGDQVHEAHVRVSRAGQQPA